MGASVDDVSALLTLGGVVRTMDSATDALPPGWLEPVKGFSHGGYYAGEPGTGKSDALISPKTAATLGQQPGSNRAEERGFG
jgi:hypothetical protein